VILSVIHHRQNALDCTNTGSLKRVSILQCGRPNSKRMLLQDCAYQDYVTNINVFASVRCDLVSGLNAQISCTFDMGDLLQKLCAQLQY
jgi:hypothetical protein